MNHLNFAAAVLLKAHSVFGKREPTHAEPSAATLNSSLTGATFFELEPDLAKEAGQYTRSTYS